MLSLPNRSWWMPSRFEKPLNALLDSDDCTIESEPSLKEPRLVDDVLAGAKLAVGLFVLGGQHDDGKCGPLHHPFENVANGVTGARPGLVRLDLVTVLLVQMVLQLIPQKAPAVTYEDSRRRLRRRGLLPHSHGIGPLAENP